MKLRTGFVSNSSSSSFVIKLKDLTEEQIAKIKKHAEIADDKENVWNIVETKTFIKGSTYMDNFDMCEYLHETVGIDDSLIEWKN
jgi:hypothetical protein